MTSQLRARKTIKQWCDYIKKRRKGKGFDTCWSNVMEKLMLVVTEVAEAAEAYRHLHFKTYVHQWPQHDAIYENFKEELADTAIRLFDLAGALDIDLEEAIDKKMKVNETRPIKHGKNC